MLCRNTQKQMRQHLLFVLYDIEVNHVCSRAFVELQAPLLLAYGSSQGVGS